MCPSTHTTVLAKEAHIGDDKPQNTVTNHDGFCKDNSQLLSMDWHDNIYKFPILKDNPDVTIGEPVKNWKNSNKEIFYDGEVTYTRTTKNIIISIERRFLEEIKSRFDMDKRDENIKTLFIGYARKFQERFDIKLDLNPEKIMCEIKSIDGFKSPVQFRSEKMKCVYNDMDLEATKRDAVKSWGNFMDNLAIETKADSILKVLDVMNGNNLQDNQIRHDFSKNIATHTLAIKNLVNVIDKLDKRFTPKVENPFLKPLENLLGSAVKIQEAMKNA